MVNSNQNIHMELIQPNSPEYFDKTSDELYDRHIYRLIYRNTDGHKDFESWEGVQSEWFHTPSLLKSHIEILDKKKKTNGGFK